MDRLPQIIRSIPRPCFEKNNRRALTYLFRDLLLLVFIGTLILFTENSILQILLSVLMGCVLTGIFVIGHDAGHRSFSDNRKLNEFVGHLCCSLTLWPYHVWRLSHDHHHKWTHHSVNDLAWKPLTIQQYEELPQWKKFAYYLSRSFVFFWASMLFQGFMIDDAVKGRFFAKQDRDIVIRSIGITIAIGLTYAFTCLYFGGLSGLLLMFIIPQLVFQFWLSFFTLFHHTNVDSKLLSPSTWEPAKAQLGHSIHVKYPDIIDWLTHDIGWHIPHHVCVSIPHYNLRAAHQSLKNSYPEVIKENSLTPQYMLEVISKCHLIDQTDTDPIVWKKIEFSWFLGNQGRSIRRPG